jgi:hypothetical protein
MATKRRGEEQHPPLGVPNLPCSKQTRQACPSVCAQRHEWPGICSKNRKSIRSRRWMTRKHKSMAAARARSSMHGAATTDNYLSPIILRGSLRKGLPECRRRRHRSQGSTRTVLIETKSAMCLVLLRRRHQVRSRCRRRLDIDVHRPCLHRLHHHRCSLDKFWFPCLPRLLLTNAAAPFRDAKGALAGRAIAI